MKVPDNLLFSLFIEQDARIKKGLSEKTLDVSTGRRVRALRRAYCHIQRD